MSTNFICGKVDADDGKEVLFYIATPTGRSAKYSVIAVSSNDEVWCKNFAEKRWEDLLKEAEIESTTKLFEKLDEKTTKVSLQHSADALQIAWSTKDEDGLFEEVFSVDLEQEDVSMFNVLSRLLTVTQSLGKRTFEAEDQLRIVDNKLGTLIKRVNDLQVEKNGIEDKLIAKFAAIMASVNPEKK